jgi:hypothetical protein
LLGGRLPGTQAPSHLADPLRVSFVCLFFVFFSILMLSGQCGGGLGSGDDETEKLVVATCESNFFLLFRFFF